MAYRRLIDKFTAAYDLLGIFLHDSGRIIPLTQKDPRGLVILRENQNKLSQKGNQELSYQGSIYGAIISETTSKAQLILLAVNDRIPVLKKHWSRILPAVLKTLPVDEIVEEESPVTKLARVA
ncbi:MAG: hypothetical protein ACXAC7_12530, partial [Candidatus Hodarchaeales archaeon]